MAKCLRANYLRALFGSYSQTFNLRHGRSGTLFEDPYEAIPVGTDEYLHQLCRYIHANPVQHGIADTVDPWPYSNYHEWIGTRAGKIIDSDFIQEHFGTAAGYQAYLQSYITGQAIMPDGLQEYLNRIGRSRWNWEPLSSSIMVSDGLRVV